MYLRVVFMNFRTSIYYFSIHF